MATRPKRIQRKRVKGWRMPPGAVYVGRPTRWGNPCDWRPPLDRLYAVRSYDNWLAGCLIARDLYGEPPTVEAIRHELSGRDLACFCPLTAPCHADVLLEIANGD